jgi:hypothetical protein
VVLESRDRSTTKVYSSYPRIFPFSGQRMKGLGEEEQLALLKLLAIISSKREEESLLCREASRTTPLKGVLAKRSFHEAFTLFKAQTKRITASLDYTLVT